jgi:hypothetical protein
VLGCDNPRSDLRRLLFINRTLFIDNHVVASKIVRRPTLAAWPRKSGFRLEGAMVEWPMVVGERSSLARKQC